MERDCEVRGQVSRFGDVGCGMVRWPGMYILDDSSAL